MGSLYEAQNQFEHVGYKRVAPMGQSYIALRPFGADAGMYLKFGVDTKLAAVAPSGLPVCRKKRNPIFAP
jgi:hypothetical protein